MIEFRMFGSVVNVNVNPVGNDLRNIPSVGLTKGYGCPDSALGSINFDIDARFSF